MTLKEKLSMRKYYDKAQEQYVISFDDFCLMFDAHNAELIAEMEKMKSDRIISAMFPIEYQNNKKISACQRLVEGKNG